MIQLWFDTGMTQKTQQPGHMLIRGGVILAVLGVVLFLAAGFSKSGGGNPGLMFGMIVVGLLIVAIGYLKRRA